MIRLALANLRNWWQEWRNRDRAEYVQGWRDNGR